MAQNLDLNSLIPQALKNETLTSLVSNLFNRFLSQESSVQVNGTIGTPVTGQPAIQPSDLDRDLNALTPGLYIKTGTEESVFTFEDFINRLNVLDVDVNDMRAWMAEQTFNFTLPIDYDKFINYSNYYWTPGITTGKGPSWNPNGLPEFYVISQPAFSDLVKNPVRLATTRNVNLYFSDRPTETFTLTFSSIDTFSVTSNLNADGTASTVQHPIIVTRADGMVSGTLNDTVSGHSTKFSLSVSDPNNGLVQLCSFTITNGTANFSGGDYFTLEITYFSSEIFISLNSPNLIGKGALSGVNTTSSAMLIDGQKVTVGERVLVWKQTNPAENGIYRVLSGAKWKLTQDANQASYFPVGSKTFVMSGATHAGHTFQSSGTLGTNLAFADLGSTEPLNVNQWQYYNQWVHRDDMPLYADRGFTLANSVQATRPIIEFSHSLELNAGVDSSGNPSAGTNLPQVKTRFNQIPQFNLYNYDGTHSGSTSGIFFYVENPDYTIDDVLIKRVQVDSNGDFVFGTGLADSQGRTLFFKKAGQLQSAWRPGVQAPTIISKKYSGVGNGTISVTPTATSDNQEWTITAVSATTFSAVGTRAGMVGPITVGTQFTCDDLSILITAGSTAFGANDSLSFTVIAPVSPRYAYRAVDGSVLNYQGGPAADANNVSNIGTWMTPVRMFQNLDRETRQQVAFGDFMDHARSVIRYQDGFSGTSFGDNNVRSIEFNPGYGGTIREFGSNFPLFASMMCETDVSPLTMIDFAEQQYNIALSSIDQFLVNELAGYLASVGGIETTQINPNGSDIQALMAYFEELRTKDQNLSAVFSDTTAKVANWPATLPMIGLLPVTVPSITYDMILGLNVMVHHDGHVSPIAVRDFTFDRNLVKSIVTRSDGTKSAGFFSETQPSAPYARQLWITPSTFVLQIFDVDYDTVESPSSPTAGQVWYNRSTNSLKVWDVSGAWLPAPFSVGSRWVPMDTAAIKNSLIWAVENKLYGSVHPAQQQNLDLSFANGSAFAEVELARYASKYNLDTFAPNYVATDAFTWNYSQAVIPGLASTPARWFDIYSEYFNVPGVSISTIRPDVEPWKLLNFASKPATWDANYASTVVANPLNTAIPARVVSMSNITLFGLQVIDGVQLANGDRVLVLGQSLPQFNGVYIASASGWTRSNDVIGNGITLNVLEGQLYSQTTWALTTASPITIGTTPLTFGQVRMWKQQMWNDILAIYATLTNPPKLCVNIYNDVLLPPYVSSTSVTSSQAILTTITTIPSGTANGYTFGQNGPVETAWKKSLEYLYGLARSYFRLSPLKFLDKSWGETYITVGDNLRVERNTLASLPASKFLMHGEKYNIINSYSSSQVQQRISGVAGSSLTVNAVVSHTADNVTVFDVSVNGTVQFLTYLGASTTGSFGGATFTNFKIVDLGIPYELGDTITIVFDSAGAATFSFTTGTMKKFKGTGQWFTNLLRYSYIDTDVSPAANAYRGWELKLVHRIGSLIRPDSLSISSVQGNLPETAYSVILKKALNTESKWLSALRVQLVQMGTKVLLPSGLYAPSGNAADWIFRVETYNPAHPQAEYFNLDYVKQTFIGVGNGSISNFIPKKDSQIVTITCTNTDSTGFSTFSVYSSVYGLSSKNVNLNEFYDDGNVSFIINGPNINSTSAVQFAVGDTFTIEIDAFKTFNALNGQNTNLAWDHPTTVVSVETTTMPIQITGLQNVVNFIFGYVDKLTADGWTIKDDVPTVDAETGRNLDWQLEIEKLINIVYGGISAGDGHILNPFMDKTILNTPIGLLSAYTQSNFTDPYSTQAIYDVNGTVIPMPSITVVRTDDKAVTHSTTPIFSSHVFIDEYEHAILFNQKFSNEIGANVIFDPFLGLRLTSTYMSFSKQAYSNGKPTFDGFFLNGNGVSRNISSSIDAIGDYYNPSKTNNEPTTAQHALSLLGYQSKDYFSNLNISDSTQFNFWRGLIQAKGTNMTVNAFTNYKTFVDGSVDEFWAYKVAEFGDARERTFPEIHINASDVTSKFARLQFYSADDTSYSALPLFTQIEASDDTRWFSIDDLGTSLKFEATRITETISIPSAFPVYVKLANIYHNGDSMSPTISLVTVVTDHDSSGKVINVTTTSAASSLCGIINASMVKITGSPSAPALKQYQTCEQYFLVSGYTWSNPTKFSPVKLFDYVAETLVDQIPLWHPAIGIHAYSPLEVVNMITATDPAHYNYTTQTSNNPNYRHLKAWASREVGRVWWDVSNLAYIPYYDAAIFPNRETRHSRWGALAEWATIDLYQWVESDYHPSEYNAQAAMQEGDSTIDASVRLSGTVGKTQYYSRNREVFIRPIAWSQTGSANPNGHPSFGPDQVDIWVMGNVLLADTGRVADIQLTAGRSVGAWSSSSKPVGEVLLGTVISYDIGSSTLGPNSPVINVPATTTSGTISALQFSSVSGTVFGTSIGQMTLSMVSDTSAANTILRMSDEAGNTSDVVVGDWTTNDLVKVFKFSSFGIQLSVTRSTSGTFYSADIVTAIVTAVSDVFVREGIQFTTIIGLPGTFFSNYPSASKPFTDYGWKSWIVPTQAQLDADLISSAKWFPYLGDTVQIPTVSADVAAEMSATTNSLTLKSGISITRYSTSWSSWVPLEKQIQEQVSNGTTNVVFTLGSTIDTNRLSMYINGVQVNPGGYVVAGDSVTLVNIIPEGSTIRLLYRAYQPTAKELAFDPSVKEDFTIQTQYKLDYQYTVLEVRDANGNVTGNKYYFWVQNTSIPSPNQSMSLVTAAGILKTGESMYTIFSRLLASPTSSDPYGAAYDSCAIAGLGSIVTANSVYKLRFLRDFTLRDDPEEIKLKNVHTEWTLIRQHQSSKIPSGLWNALTDAVAGQDIGGNQLPSQVRIDYDNRNGTLTRFGFKPGQIFADTGLVRTTITNTILNTKLVLNLGSISIPDYITALNMNQSDTWFTDANTARATMNLIWNTARASQINEIFFSVLDDALANNYEFTDLFKTSLITVNSTTLITPASQQEQIDELF